MDFFNKLRFMYTGICPQGVRVCFCFKKYLDSENCILDIKLSIFRKEQHDE